MECEITSLVTLLAEAPPAANSAIRVGKRGDIPSTPTATSPPRPRLPGPGNAHGETRPRERLPADDRLRQPQLAAERAHLVFEQLAQGLDQLHLHPLRQPADIVVALDHRARPLEGDALDHVRIEGPLGEKAG